MEHFWQAAREEDDNQAPNGTLVHVNVYMFSAFLKSEMKNSAF